MSKVKTRGEFNFQEIARLTPGFVGADLHSLVKEAGNIAIKRAIDGQLENLEDTYVEVNDFIIAVDNV